MPDRPLHDAADLLSDDALADRLVRALDADDAAALGDLLRDDPAAQDALIMLSLHAESVRQLAGRAPNVGRSRRAVAPIPRSAFAVASFAYALAASLAIAAVAVAIYVSALRPTPDADPVAADPTPVATLTDASDDLVWSGEPVYLGDELRRQTIRTESGDAELMLTSGTQVNVIGAAELRLDGPLRVGMIRGAASFTCPHDAAGFTVDLPDGARVVDLGTRFAVAVEPGGAIVVQVIEGSVRYEPPGAPRMVLTDRQAIAVADGRLESLSPLDPRRPVHGPAFSYRYGGTIRPAPESHRNDDRFDKLTDGVIGEPSVDHPAWIGFTDNPTPTANDDGRPQPRIDVTFAESVAIGSMRLTYLIDRESAIHAPERVVVRLSEDGGAWSEPIEATGVDASREEDPEIRGGVVRWVDVPLGGAQARYVRVEVYNNRQWTYLGELSFQEAPAGRPADRDPSSPEPTPESPAGSQP